MDKSDDHNAGSLGEHFDDFEATPNGGVWDRISGDLKDDAQRGGLAVNFDEFAPQPNKRVWAGIEAELHPERKRRAAYWWWAGAAAGLALLITTYFAWPDGIQSGQHFADDQEQVQPANDVNNETNTPNNNVADGTSAPNQNNNAQNGNTDNASVDNANAIDPSNANNQNSTDGRNNDDGINSNGTKRNDEPTINTSLAQQNNNNPSGDSGNDNNVSTDDRPQTLALTAAPLLDAGPLEVNWNWNRADSLPHFGTPKLLPKKDDGSGWMLAGNVQPYQPQTGNQQSDWVAETSLADQAVPNNSGTNSSFNDTTSITNIAFEESNLSPFSDYFGPEEFNAPINFGVTFNRQLGKRWGIESGFSYSILRSSQTAYLGSSSKIERTNVRQYIGLPVQLQFYAVKRKKLNIYFSSGTILERGLNIRIKDNLFESDEITETSSYKARIEGGQIALISGFGIDLALGKKFSIYAQPSITHYIFQSQYNLWSTQRFWGSLQTGLRIRL